jgi:hypothetical protein
VKLDRCWAVGNVSAEGKGPLAVGGLVGEVYDHNTPATSVITRCYATGNVNVASTTTNEGHILAAGGLVGLALSTEISESWAGGSVYAEGQVNSRIYIGGLVGSLGDYEGDITAHTSSSINNCYALGNVLANKSFLTSDSSYIYIYAGGLAGHVQIGSSTDTRKIEHSFAAGSVAARCLDPGDVIPLVCAGGVVGYIHANGKLSNTAALGAAVTVTGGSSTRSAKRVYPAGDGSGFSNVAVDTMRLEKGAAVAYYFPYWDGTTPEPSAYYILSASNDGNGQDGLTVSGSVFRTPSIWTPLFDGQSAAWDYSSLASRGYPTLKNVGGQ